MGAEKFRNKYRIDSVRLKHWDYGWNAPYFVTICINNRQCLLGDVSSDFKMQLSEMGEWAEKIWQMIPQQFPFVHLGEFVVMPNHIHGIIIIDKPDGDAINRVSTGISNPQNIPEKGGITGNKNPMLHNNLSRIIRWYKGRTTFECRKLHPDFAWQSRFHERVIRNDFAFERISQYIRNNPVNWGKDRMQG